MKWDPKRFGWRKVLCLLELSRAYQPSNTIHTSERRRGAASHLAKADRERLPEVQRNNAGIQTQANLEESRCSECQRPESGGGQRISPPTGLKRAAKSTLERPHKKNAKVLEQPQTPDSIPRENLWNDSKIEPYLRSPNMLSWCRCSRKRAGGEPWQKPRHHDRYSFNSGSSYHVCCEMDASWWQVITPSVSSVLASFSTFFGFHTDSKCFGLLPFQTNHRNTFHTKFPQNHR